MDNKTKLMFGAAIIVVMMTAILSGNCSAARTRGPMINETAPATTGR